MEKDGPRFVCNKCRAIVSKEEVARIVMQMESCEATCPHCGRVNHIEGFSEVFAFVCRYCGQGVSV
jgi:RNase P subunit RPR2